MTEQVEVAEQQETEVEQIDYKALYEQAQTQIQGLAKKKEELLNETKRAKQDRIEAEKAARDAENAKAQQNGEFEKLWQTESQQRKEIEQQLQNYKQQVKSERVGVEATKIAMELASHDVNSAKLLSKFLTESLNNLADENGYIDNDKIEAIKKETKTNSVYAPLLAGNRSSGGGALGNVSSRAENAEQELTRAEFAALDHTKRQAFLKKNGKLID